MEYNKCQQIFFPEKCVENQVNQSNVNIEQVSIWRTHTVGLRKREQTNAPTTRKIVNARITEAGLPVDDFIKGLHTYMVSGKLRKTHAPIFSYLCLPPHPPLTISHKISHFVIIFFTGVPHFLIYIALWWWLKKKVVGMISLLKNKDEQIKEWKLEIERSALGFFFFLVVVYLVKGLNEKDVLALWEKGKWKVDRSLGRYWKVITVERNFKEKKIVVGSSVWWFWWHSLIYVS